MHFISPFTLTVLWLCCVLPASSQWAGGTKLAEVSTDTLSPEINAHQLPLGFQLDGDFRGNALQLQDARALPDATTDLVFDQLERAWFSTREGHLYRYDSQELVQFTFPAVEAIMDLDIDASGRLWLATEGQGLIEYNGLQFVAHIPQSQAPIANFWQVLPLKNGLACASPDQGLVILESTGAVHFSKANGLHSNEVVGVTQAQDGSLVTGHWVSGWSRIDAEGVASFSDVGLAAGAQQRFLLPGNGDFAWVCSSQGLYRLSLDAQPQAALELPDVFAFSVLPHPSGGWWVGTSRHGLIHCLNGNIVAQYSLAEGLNGERVSALSHDRFGNTWVGFFEPGLGLNLLRPDVVLELGAESGLPEETVRDVHVDQSGTVWVTYPVSGLAKSTDGGAHFESLKLPTTTAANVVCMTESPDGTLWFAAGDDGVFSLKNNVWKQHPYGWEKKGSRYITSLLWAHDRLWVGGVSGLLVLEEGTIQPVKSPDGSRLCAEPLSGLLEDSRGNVWACSTQGHLWCIPFHLTANKHSEIRAAQVQLVQEDSTYLSPFLHDLAETTDEFLWMATDGYGILGIDLRPIWEKADGVSTLVAQTSPSAEDLGGANVFALLRDPEGQIWSTSSDGLIRWRPTSPADRKLPFEGHIPNWFGGWQGLAHAAFDEDAHGAIDANGQIYFGSRQSVIRLSRGCSLPELPPPAASIAQVMPGGRPANWSAYTGQVKHQKKPGGIRAYFPKYVQYPGLTAWTELPVTPVFSYDQNHLDFELRGIQWGNTTPLRYRYRLNQSEMWSPLRTQQIPTFQSLPPGEYALEIQAADALGHLGGIQTFPFTIELPVWRTPVFLVVATLLALLIIYGVYRWRVRKLRRENQVLEEKVNERTEELRVEKQKSDDLLLNILPRSTAEELKEHGKAQTQSYESCSVLFSDFKGFTSLTETVDSHTLVSVLDRFFQGFDDAAVRYGLEKIKTIGDAYMCAAGIPNPTDEHAARMVAFGLEMLRITANLNQTLQSEGLDPWPIRIGVHSGPVIAGVVGKNKFAYDVWGDTVNTAARMESSGEPGQLNISAATAERVQSYFELEERGAIAAKNKGNLEMYFVKGFKKEYAKTDDSSTPNADFARVIRQNVVFSREM